MVITDIIPPGVITGGITVFTIPGITAGTAPGTIPGVGTIVITVITPTIITLPTQPGVILLTSKHPENRLTPVQHWHREMRLIQGEEFRSAAGRQPAAEV